MKNVNFKIVFALILSAMIFAGCGLGKMIKKYPTVTYTVTPEVLESQGGKVTVGIKGTVPAKYFDKKASVKITPVIKDMQGNVVATLKPFTLKGEKASGEGQTIKYKTGGTFSYTDVVNYTPEMKMSELHVAPLGYKGKKVDIPLGKNKLADGVINTSSRIEPEEDVQIADHGYELETIITKKANLYFEYNKSTLNTNLALNKDLANKAQFDALFAFLCQNWKIKSIDINAWASPEGELSLNQKLSDERGKTAKKWLDEQLKKIVIKDKKLINASVAPVVPEKGKKAPKIEVPQFTLNINSKGEDYDGFMKALNASNIPQKQTIANVINGQETKAQREKTINDMTKIYVEVENMLSVLRRAEFVVNCYEPKKTKEDILLFATTSPEKLDNKEILYAATLTEDVNKKYQIYKAATNMFSQDWKAFNNAGACALLLNKLDEADNYLSKANTLSPNNAQVLYNLGVLAFRNQKDQQAESFFSQAKSKNIDCSFNDALLKIRKGDYAGALTSFGSKKCKYNLALAQLLSGNNAAAKQTLDCTKPQTAAVYYLTAVNAARTANTAVMYEYLKKAVQADAKYKKEAAEDREFLKYYKEAAFQDAIK